MLRESQKIDSIIDAALELASERSWSEVTLPDIAQAAEMELSALRDAVSSKDDIIAAFVQRIDKKMLGEAANVDRSSAPRDALFEVLMSRFDAMEPHKRALKSIVGLQIPNPDLIKTLLQSQTWMLQAAGIESEGLKGGVRVVGLMSVYASVFQTWLEDDDPGLAHTMAVLDRRLRRGERSLGTADNIIGSVEGLCKSMMSMWPKPSTPRGPETDGPTSSNPEASGSAPL